MLRTRAFKLITVASLSAGFLLPSASASASPSADPGSTSVAASEYTPAPAAPEPPAAYTVVLGDTLWDLGPKLGTTWLALAGFNHLGDPSRIGIGLVLQVPPATYVPPPLLAPLPAPAPGPGPVPARRAYVAPTPVPYAAPAAVERSGAGCYGQTDPNALYVIGRESGCSPTARNPSGACGIGQLMASCPSDPYAQVSAMNAYVAGRYGSWAAAAAHERAFSWY